MEKNEEKFINSRPAGYPRTSTAENESVILFRSLLCGKYFRGDIRTEDKVPNTDGILEIIDDDLIPVAKIDVQLKTLEAKNYTTPKYQCEKEFLAYCEESVLPVILVAVNRQDRKAYWRHIDRLTLMEASSAIKGASVSIDLPIANCIDGTNTEFRSIWTSIYKDLRRKQWNYDQLSVSHKKILAELKNITEASEGSSDPPLSLVKELHHFLDQYNYILDIEFPSIKSILYPNFWKIGIGIVAYHLNEIRYTLYPVEYKKDQTLVKKVQIDSEKSLSTLMRDGNILSLGWMANADNMLKFPRQAAYDMLDDPLLKAVAQNNLPIPDEFLSREYLISFIDNNADFMGVEKHLRSYDLADLRFRLQSLLPMYVVTNSNYADWVTEANTDIESYSNYKRTDRHLKRLDEAKKKVEEGFEPKVKVRMQSKEYNIDLIYYYIDFLEEMSIKKVERVYHLNQYDEKNFSTYIWQRWNMDVLWQNFQIFIENVHRCYDLYLSEHFWRLKKELSFSAGDHSSLAYVLNFDTEQKTEPNIELYKLRPISPMQPEIFFFVNEESPIDRKKYFIDREFDCVINGEPYTLVGMQGMGVEMLFKVSPIYAFIKHHLDRKLRDYFQYNSKKD